MNEGLQPRKRISVELNGDDVILADILTTSLRLTELSKSKSERDEALLTLALKALNKAMSDYRAETGVKYPNHEQMKAYLAD